MPLMEIAIDVGTTNTSIYVSGNGVVLREPTLVAYMTSNSAKRILAIGSSATVMRGKMPENTALVSPVINGVIVDPSAASSMLRDFFKKIIPDSYFPPRVKAIVAIPTGLTSEQRQMYEDVVYSASRRIKQVVLIESVILSAIGIGLSVKNAAGGFIANIGGGSTEIAALSLSGIIAGCGLSLGGELMDTAITDMIVAQHNVKLGRSLVQKLKEQLASLFENDMSFRPASGMDLDAKTLSSVTIRASDLYAVLQPYYLRVGTAIESILNMCPPDAASEFNRKGIYIVGGAAKIPGLKEMLSKKLGLPVVVPQDPEYATINGAGLLLGDKELLKSIIAHK